MSNEVVRGTFVSTRPYEYASVARGSGVRTLLSSACARAAMRRASARLVAVDDIDRYLRRCPDSPIVLDVLGTLDAGEIQALVHELDPHVEEVFFFAVS